MRTVYDHKKKSKVILSLLFAFILLSPLYTAGKTPLRFNHVSLSEDVFNPRSGESINIFFHISLPARVDLEIYDRYGNLIRHLEESYQAKKGSNKLSWDGRDDEGNIVPDEAYSFIIQAESEDGERAIYDPTRAYGEIVEIIKRQIKPEKGTLTYTLHFPSRVLIRLGSTNNGPLYKTLINWEPRPAGENTEYWDGWDETNTINLRHKDIMASYEAYTLPKNAIITKGNPVPPSEIEKKALIRKRALAPINIHPTCPQEKRSSHADPDLKIARDIGLIVTPLSGAQEEIIPVNKKRYRAKENRIMTQIDIPDEDKPVLEQEQFELIFFIDDIFLEEAEAGVSLPYDFTWDASGLTPGSHILTVNIVGLKRHLGTASFKVWID